MIRELAAYVILGFTPEGKKEVWTPKYPNSMKRWHDNRDVLREALPGSRTPHSSCPLQAHTF